MSAKHKTFNATLAHERFASESHLKGKGSVRRGKGGPRKERHLSPISLIQVYLESAREMGIKRNASMSIYVSYVLVALSVSAQQRQGWCWCTVS